MKRREFLKRTTGAGLSALFISDSIFESPRHDTQAAEVYSFSVARGKDTRKAVNASIEALGGMKRFISKNDIVMIKPNIGWDRTAVQAANTNPEVVASLVALCLSAGAKTVKVTDNTCNEARRCFKNSGIADAARSAGAEVYFLDERNIVKDKMGGDVLSLWPIYRDFKEVDKIINVPVAKHHGLTRLTLGMKNLMGAIGGRRNGLHQQIDNALADLAEYFKPTLTVVDAVRILTANGPQGGSSSDVMRTDTIIAGTDIATVDALAAHHFAQHAGKGFKDLSPSDYPFIRVAAERGLGTMNIAAVKVKEITL